jgi:hypothetical protein
LGLKYLLGLFTSVGLAPVKFLGGHSLNKFTQVLGFEENFSNTTSHSENVKILTGGGVVGIVEVFRISKPLPGSKVGDSREVGTRKGGSNLSLKPEK